MDKLRPSLSGAYIYTFRGTNALRYQELRTDPIKSLFLEECIIPKKSILFFPKLPLQHYYPLFVMLLFSESQNKKEECQYCSDSICHFYVTCFQLN